MADANHKSADQKIEGATQAVPAKTGEVSDTELEKVAGGSPSEQVTLNYDSIQVEYQQQK